MRKKVLLIFFLAACTAVLYIFDLERYFTLEWLKTNKAGLYHLYEQHRLMFISGYVALYVLACLSFLPIAAVLTLAGGALFGVFTGGLLAVTGASIGAVLAFLVARTLLREWVIRAFGEKITVLDQGISRDGLSYLLFLRLVPVFPFFLINVACGLTNIRLGTYFLGTTVGIIPGCFVYANAGASIASVSSMHDVAGPRVLISFALLGIFALIPVLYRLIRRK